MPNREALTWENDGRCGAQLRGQPGVFCQKFPVKGRTRCRFHGGKSPTGYDHPSFLHGRRSRYRVRRGDYERVTRDLAMAGILYDRAVAAGSSGLAELRHVARCHEAYADLVVDRVLPPELRPSGVLRIQSI